MQHKHGCCKLTLASATLTPALMMNSNAGVIEAGRRADLVILNQNPLNDIKNTRTIDTVILNGRVFERKQLDAMLESSSRSQREQSKDQY